MTPEVHLFIIWAEAFPYADYVIGELSKKFIILEVLEVFCDFSRSIIVQQCLYGFSQKDAELRCVKNELSNYIAVIVRVEAPEYIITTARWGEARVERHLYSEKTALRNCINLPYGIHGTIDNYEAEHDILVATGFNIQVFSEKTEWNHSVKKIILDEELL